MINDIKINGIDAFTEWGINLEDGAISALMNPSPMKEFIVSKNRVSHGSRYVTCNAKFDERELTIPFHLIAKSREEFFTKYNKFCNEVLGKGTFELTSRFIPGAVFRLIYITCNQFRQFDGRLAVFSLKVKEPDPTNRNVKANI